MEFIRENFNKIFSISFYEQFDYLYSIINSAEASVFITSSGIINALPERMPFQYFYPFYKALIHPLPSFLFDKNPGDYMDAAIFSVYQNKMIGAGASYLYFVEYYIMFGWLGIIFFSFLLGFLFKKIWLWVNLHKDEPLALIVYIINVSFIFMIITRGYLPQQLHLYIFTVFPLDLIYILNAKKIRSKIIK